MYPYCLAADTNVTAALKSVFTYVVTLNLAQCTRPATCTPLERRQKHATSICVTERLTPCSKVLLEKPTVPLLLKQWPATDEPPATAPQLSLSWARYPVHTYPPHFLKIHLIIHSHQRLVLQVVPFLYNTALFQARHMPRQTYLPLFYHSNTSGGERSHGTRRIASFPV